jgi:hypothetical protein
MLNNKATIMNLELHQKIKGTAKQQHWAYDIRMVWMHATSAKIANLRLFCEREPNHALGKIKLMDMEALAVRLNSVTDASWIIENRNRNIDQLAVILNV